MNWIRTAQLVATVLVLSACASGSESQRAMSSAAARAPAAPGLAPNELPDSVIRAVDEVFVEYNDTLSPGCAVGVVRSGDLTVARGYGMASVEHDVPITPTTPFYAASVSKQFTAFAVALLADQGKLSLDDDVRKWIPELPDLGRTITIRHLLHHTSGLRDYFSLLRLGGWPNDGRITKAEFMELVSRQRELNFEPGSRYLYNNTGYVLAAILVERVSGQSLREFTQTHLFKPLGMTRTTFRDDHTMLVEDRALAYTPTSEAGYRLSMPGFDVVGDGGLYTTIEDLARWARNFDSKEVGGAGVARMMLTPGVLSSGDTLDYALGLGIGNYRGLATVSHSGSNTGYRAYFMRFRDHDLAVLTLCNRADASAALHSREVAEVFLRKHMKSEEDRAPATPGSENTAVEDGVELEPAILERFAGLYRVDNVGVLVRFSRNGDRMRAAFVDEPEPMSLIALSDTVLQVASGTGRVVFDAGSDRDEVPQEATWHWNGGGTYTLRRVGGWDPGTTQLKEFVGRYYSPEAMTFYTIELEHGRLSAHHYRLGDLPLTPVDTDTFGSEYPLYDVRFERGENEKVTGFLVSGARIKDVWFEKQE